MVSSAKARYSVSTEDVSVYFRWKWQAVDTFRRLPLARGQSVLLVKWLRNGAVRCLDERYRESTPPS